MISRYPNVFKISLLQHLIVEPSKIAADDTFNFVTLKFIFRRKQGLMSCESSARQRIHMKHHLNINFPFVPNG